LYRVRKRKHKSGTDEYEEERHEERREERRDERREVRREERRDERREDRREDKKKLSDKERERLEASERRRELAKKAPPPLDFQSLLKVANNVKDIPVQVKSSAKKEVKEASIGNRPMTKKVIARRVLRNIVAGTFFPKSMKCCCGSVSC
jgi:hypothetical protein